MSDTATVVAEELEAIGDDGLTSDIDTFVAAARAVVTQFKEQNPEHGGDLDELVREEIAACGRLGVAPLEAAKVYARLDSVAIGPHLILGFIPADDMHAAVLACVIGLYEASQETGEEKEVVDSGDQ